jgi:hypothetical protein
VVTCHIRYTIDPYKLGDFERYARAWIPLVNRLGGEHHGFFLPQDGANDAAFSLFSLPSLAAYEEYREALATAEETRCVLRYERSFTQAYLGVKGRPPGVSAEPDPAPAHAVPRSRGAP